MNDPVGGIGTTVWQVGEFDKKSDEFALMPNKGIEFGKKFEGPIIYTIGQSKPSDLPFIHPSSMDSEWSKQAQIPFMFKFNLAEVAKFDYGLLISLTDTHAIYPSNMEVAVNGQVIATRRMPVKAGRAFDDGTPDVPTKFFYVIPSDRFKSGANELSITLKDGSWVAYDAISLIKLNNQSWDCPAESSVEEGYEKLAVEEFQSQDSIVLTKNDMSRMVLYPNGSISTNTDLLKGCFETEFLVKMSHGKYTLSYEVPGAQKGSVWQVAVYPSNWHMKDTVYSRAGKTTGGQITPGWLKVHVLHQPGTATITVEDSKGRIAKSAVHSCADNVRQPGLESWGRRDGIRPCILQSPLGRAL